MSGLQIRGKLNAEELIVSGSEGLLALCSARPMSRDGSHFLLRFDANYLKLFIAANAGAQEGRATESAGDRLDVEAGRVWRLLAVVDRVSRMAEEGEHLSDVSDWIVFGRLNANRVRVTTEAR